ncbi:MAG: hypothetical protein WA071_24915 [Undibacterium umbellatum]|uniref:hypothetical protein n=1 Tax=Undibacterium umbellatum TaxID=2762300 RepID=UPI003BB7BB5B
MKLSQLFKGLLATLVICSASTSTVFANDAYGREHRWHPAPPVHHVARNYNYVYYPSHQVYYAPAQGSWYWANGRGWETGRRLPYGLNLDVRVGGVPIVLSSPRPYVEHVYVEQTYGHPLRDRHEWRHGRRHEREWREERRERHHGHHGHYGDYGR